ncbi:MAG: lysine--tRNA ligase [Candidatus Staskawiczbacteria bacterium]|nr:lysine--tRNA ligase [Candidatus Staskawiczbacteria bacterium]
MPTINELKKVRLKKLRALEKAGFLTYPAKTKRTHSINEVLDDFSKLVKSKKAIVLVGRIMALREHGGATFLDIQDGTGKIQVLAREDKLGPKGYKFFIDHFDIGDFIEVEGILFTTKRGEKTIQAKDYKMLAKSILPLPEKWHGLLDIEERLRKRYLDILFNPEVKEMVKKKALFWNSMREFLIKKGFLEVETPVLETTTGGADAQPFETHYNALNFDVYLRISMGELWQKRLMVAGFEKTFEIGRQFRNEGMDAEHLQDYTQMEFYWAYADYKQGMKLVEEMYKYVVKKTFGKLKFKIKGFNVDLSKKWEIYDYRTIINKYAKIDVFEASLPEMEKTITRLNITAEGFSAKGGPASGWNKTRAIDNLFKYCRKNIAGPGFLINLPIEVSPLAKRDEKNPKIAQRFQVILAGSENGNGYSELNDPIDQAQRFAQQQKLREQGDQEAQMFDHDFVEALEYGMPPACGFGVSERLFSFLMDKPSRECQIFPLMRPKN